ncbi:cytochrome c oxidase subunit II [soil metagenome]
MPGSVTEQGDAVAEVWRFFALAAAAVGILVWGLILWSVFRYRRRSDELPKQTLYHLPIEILYTTVPLILVAVLFTVSIRGTQVVNARSENPDITIDVTAFQWQWRFDYRDIDAEVIGQTDNPAEMMVPVGATIRINLTSTDVIHAFWLPEFMIKKDAIPHRVNEFDMTVTTAGTFDSGRCVEYCGLNHADMRFTVRAVPQAEFDEWIEQMSTTGGQPRGRP